MKEPVFEKFDDIDLSDLKFDNFSCDLGDMFQETIDKIESTDSHWKMALTIMGSVGAMLLIAAALIIASVVMIILVIGGLTWDLIVWWFKLCKKTSYNVFSWYHERKKKSIKCSKV